LNRPATGTPFFCTSHCTLKRSRDSIMQKEMKQPAEHSARERQLRLQRERRLWRAGLLTALLGLAAGLYSSHPVLVRHVRLEGDCSPCPPEITEIIRPLLGRQWVLVRVGAVRRRLTDVPLVKRATVWKWPPGELTVRIEKRTPALVLKTSTGVFPVDREGVLFEDTALRLSTLPLLSGSRFRGLQPGDRLADRDLHQILDCLAGARSTGLPPVHKLVVDELEGVTLYTAGPLCFRLGRRYVRQKLVLAACAMKQLRREGKDSGTFDLRVLTASTWSPQVG